MRAEEKVEILGLDLFQTLRQEMQAVERAQKLLMEMGIGWHYYLDLAWLINEVRPLPRGSLILDAGAGVGLAQFILVELGYNVISVDFCDRTLTPAQAQRYRDVVVYLNRRDEKFSHPYLMFVTGSDNQAPRPNTKELVKRILKRLLGQVDTRRKVTAKIEQYRFNPQTSDTGPAPSGIEVDTIMNPDLPDGCGKIFMYRADLRNMRLLPDEYVDAVVSVSALEHNDRSDIEKCVSELLRVTKPGGRFLTTVSASLEEDWLHEPSRGWCYSENTLKSLFQLPDDVKSNYSQRHELFERLKRKDNELHKRLGRAYYLSGNNGMPWGKWDPKYQPAGVVKIRE